MNCHTYRDALLDLARDVEMAAALRRALDAHVHECARCATELRRQQDLTMELRSLARAAHGHAPSGAVGDRLLAIFVAGRADQVVMPARGRKIAWWGGAAAAAVLIAAAVLDWTSVPGSPSARAPEREAHLAPTVAAPDVSRVAPRASMALPAPRAAVNSGPTDDKRGRPAPRPQHPRPVRTLEFLAIPGAASLPPLESATIIRTALPVSALPIYGVDISSRDPRAGIEADLLVGQDGQARAIRFVTAEPMSK